MSLHQNIPNPEMIMHLSVIQQYKEAEIQIENFCKDYIKTLPLPEVGSYARSFTGFSLVENDSDMILLRYEEIDNACDVHIKSVLIDFYTYSDDKSELE